MAPFISPSPNGPREIYVPPSWKPDAEASASTGILHRLHGMGTLCLQSTPVMAVRHEPGRPSIFLQVLGLASRITPKRSIVFCLRFLTRPATTLGWMTFLGDFARRQALGNPHDDLVRKSLSTFFAKGITGRERLKLLGDHFRTAGDVLSSDALAALWHGDVVEMGTVTGRGESYKIQLLLADHCGSRHEGAFAVRLARARDGFTLCTASFVFVPCGDTGYSLAIGGMQGPRAADAKRALVAATRCLGGLRPKDAVLLVLHGVISAGNADHILAVSNARHVINLRRRKRRRMMRVDLDDYWRERGGEEAAPFGFRLPVKSVVGTGNESRREQSKLAFWQVGARLLLNKTAPETGRK